MNDIRLKVFVEVAENKSFSKAAKKLFLTQPGVSLHIQKLEDRYATRLFDRQEKEVSLTEAGRIFYLHAKKILDINKEMEEELFSLIGKVTGKLTIGASTTIGEYTLPRILGRFREIFPQVEILLKISNTKTIIRQLTENNLDLGLIEGPCHNPKMVIKKFLQDELVLIVPNRPPWSYRKLITLEEVYSSGLIIREPGSGSREVIEEYFRKLGNPLDDSSVIMELGSSEAIKSVVEAGIGIAIISKWTLLKELKLKTLKILPIKNLSIQRDFNFVYPKEGFQSKLVSNFMKICLEESY